MIDEADLPRIQVVTVCRNDLHGLRATLSSVDEQTFAPVRQVVQDGASTDGTVPWLADTPRPPWREVRSEQDDGIYDAMNRALDGEWDLVLFLNSGDRFASRDVLERIAVSWRERGWPWAVGRARLLRNDGTVVRVHELSFLRRPRFFAGVRSVPHQAVVLSRAMVDLVGPHRIDIGLSADQEYLFRCWHRREPARLDLIVADCDAAGVSAEQEPGAFAFQMQMHRTALNRPILGSGSVDRAVTRFAVAWDSAKRRYGGIVRDLRA